MDCLEMSCEKKLESSVNEGDIFVNGYKMQADAY